MRRFNLLSGVITIIGTAILLSSCSTNHLAFTNQKYTDFKRGGEFVVKKQPVFVKEEKVVIEPSKVEPSSKEEEIVLASVEAKKTKEIDRSAKTNAESSNASQNEFAQQKTGKEKSELKLPGVVRKKLKQLENKSEIASEQKINRMSLLWSVIVVLLLICVVSLILPGLYSLLILCLVIAAVLLILKYLGVINF